MMEEDSEVFEITDFTTASDWERFVSKLEEVLHEWKLVSPPPSTLPPLPKGILSKGEWTEEQDRIQFADFHFCVKHHQLVSTAETESDDVQSPLPLPPPKTIDKKIEDLRRHHSSKSPTPGSSGDDENDDDDDDDGQLPRPLFDAMEMENDFPSKCHCLARWHGLREFVSIQVSFVENNLPSKCLCFCRATDSILVIGFPRGSGKCHCLTERHIDFI